ncbi:MAG: DinB family protein [Saprospiraceae bacterium]|nr:DinB family protein [Saprospiraceae bacterium]
MSFTIGRPTASESASFYHAYIANVPGDDPIAQLKQASRETVTSFQEIPNPKWDFRYAPGKWTVKELVLHMIDAERIFAYRALRFGRNDMTPLPGFDQDIFVPNSGANTRSPESLIKEYQHVRDTSIQLFKHLPNEAWDRVGIASDNPVSVRAIAFIIAGHELHHLRILKERYLQDGSHLA